MMGNGMEALTKIRHNTGEPRTVGLRDEVIRDFLESDPSLGRAIDEASDNFQSRKRIPETATQLQYCKFHFH